MLDISEIKTIELKNEDKTPQVQALEYYHVPIAAPDQGIMIFSDF